MPDIQITDKLDQPVATVPVDLAHPSSLVKYLKTELLHLAIAPDFLERKDKSLSLAAPKPILFAASAQHSFQLGNTQPEISITPSAKVAVRVNTSAGKSLFEDDPFPAPAVVPEGIGYVSTLFEGSLDLGVSGASGDLSFGMDKTSAIKLEYLKAFRLGTGEAALGAALTQTLASFVIPADVSDLDALGVNDLATVSGSGSLKISGAVSVSVTPNPLASVNLPLGAGAVAVQAGATAGLSASLTIDGSYQVRTRRKDLDTVELSFHRERGTSLKMDLSASAGITAKLGDTDLVAAALGAISTDPAGDKKLFADLKAEELERLKKAVKGSLNQSLQASFDAVLSAMTDEQAAFQYEIKPAQLSGEAQTAVHKALDGDLTLLTAMEEGMQPGGVLAPGVKMLSSLLTETRKHGITLKINLLGILNCLTVSSLVRNSEVLTDEVSGDITIKETVTGTRISAISEPIKRDEALGKAMFDSLLATTCYRAGNAVAIPNISCSQVHFAYNHNTNSQTMGDYLSWFVALNLLTPQDKETILEEFLDGGASSCVLRTSFDDALCSVMFFDGLGNPRTRQDYLEIGRHAMRALLDPDHQAIDALRDRILEDDLWPAALKAGASSDLGALVKLSQNDPRMMYLVGDMMDILHWADTLVQAGSLVGDMRAFVGKSDPRTLMHDNQFKQKRDALQQKLAALVKASKTRFDEPWGMVCLFWAAGSPRTAYGKTKTAHLTVERGAQISIPAVGKG